MMTLLQLLAITLPFATIFASVTKYTVIMNKTEFERKSNPTETLSKIATNLLKLKICTSDQPCTRKKKKQGCTPKKEKHGYDLPNVYQNKIYAKTISQDWKSSIREAQILTPDSLLMLILVVLICLVRVVTAFRPR